MKAVAGTNRTGPGAGFEPKKFAGKILPEQFSDLLLALQRVFVLQHERIAEDRKPRQGDISRLQGGQRATRIAFSRHTASSSAEVDMRKRNLRRNLKLFAVPLEICLQI